jgi:hypothetical protein
MSDKCGSSTRPDASHQGDVAAVRLTSRAGGSRQTSGSLAGLRLCMVMHAGIRWRVSRVTRPAGPSAGLENRAHPGPRMSAKDPRPAQQGPVRWRPRRRVLSVSQRSTIGTVDGPTTYDRAWPHFVSRVLHSPLSMVRRSQPSPSRLRLTTAAGQSWDKALGSWSSSSTPYSGRCVRSGPEVVPTDREPPPAPPDDTVTETTSSRRQQLGQLRGISSVRLRWSEPYRCPASGWVAESRSPSSRGATVLFSRHGPRSFGDEAIDL